MQNHITQHKRKYVGFFLVAILVTSGTYVIFKTEASDAPQSNMMVPGMRPSRDCPPFLLRMQSINALRHPCFLDVFRNEQNQQPASSQESDQAPVFQTETDVVASSSPEIDQDTASTTPEESSETASTTVEATVITPVE